MTVHYYVITSTLPPSFFFRLSFFPENFFSSFFVPPPFSLLRRRCCLIEEVPAHVHPGPIVLDVLTRQHEHRSELIWSGDHEMCFTDLQFRCFGRNLFQCYSTAPRRLLRENDHTYWGTQHASHVEVKHQRRLHIKDGSALAVEILSYPNDEYIRWYQEITRVYIGNPNCDTRSVRYQPAGVDRQMMVHSKVSFFWYFYAFHFFMIDF
ncbi:hypothetical protein M9H77_17245 [Catharanthus roseus]|uniref:Uncharacterized protein n=1 Tax=Catharanthus roseus TaxID=4058 RepID=A0ACC0B428_CATRO|nr:hypothetical protein M9H77_17245 [Catharanthus roseus]